MNVAPTGYSEIMLDWWNQRSNSITFHHRELS